MARYKVAVIIETNSDYTDGNQIEDIQKEISISLKQEYSRFYNRRGELFLFKI